MPSLARNLSLSGIATIIKLFGLSKFSLLTSLLSVPKEYIQKINSAVYEYLWNAKTDKVKRIIVEQEYKDGVLKMLDFNTLIKGSKIK